MTVDEIHPCKNLENPLMKKIANSDITFHDETSDPVESRLPFNADSFPTKFFLSGTPREGSPADLLGPLWQKQ